MSRRKLILKCGLSPGDIVMLTAAVRDLHRCYAKQFLTDVRTTCQDIWENNPYLTPLSEEDPEVEQIDCSYPLINRCNRAPYHCLHGFIEFLNDRLNLTIKPTEFRGDIHLSAQEKKWASQVHEYTGRRIPFWIIAAGGKYDVTVKWWESRRYQDVVNYFRGRVQFVQVGEYGHHHPKLEGGIDLRGETDLRQLIRLVYHAQGVLCPVTALMHLAAAVETKRGQPASRPCVVIAGGREPAHWEAYSDHQFIHTNGALPCCIKGGCWKDRITPLRDGNKRDRRDHLCVDVVDGIPHCMDMISSEEVIRRIEMYFDGGTTKYLSASEQAAAGRGVIATSGNEYDQQPLNFHSAGMACDQFAGTIPGYPGGFGGRGIVICGGGVSYFTNAWVCINMLRRFGCQLPIELWHLGAKEMDEEMKLLVAPLNVKCVNADKMRKRNPARLLKGWGLKPYAILHSGFKEVLYLDADNVPVANPEYLFRSREFQNTGAVFWPDYGEGISRKSVPIWKSCGMRPPREREFETGQMLFDKERCWRALRLSLWFNENSDFYYQHLYGDKETFHLAFRKLKQPYTLLPTPIHALEKTMCQHDFDGKRIFQHRNCDKWDLFLRNRKIKDFWFEPECFAYVARLSKRWSGKIGRKAKLPKKSFPQGRSKVTRIQAILFSVTSQSDLRRQTLKNLSRTDWEDEPRLIENDDQVEGDHLQKQSHAFYLALKTGWETGASYLLVLEAGVDFNRHLHHNLQNWGLLQDGRVMLAGLYNAKARDLACDVKNNFRIADPHSVYSGKAFIISRNLAAYALQLWDKVKGAHGPRISKLAARMHRPVLFYAPSLVQSIAPPGLGDEWVLPAKDFDRNWKAHSLS